MKNLFILATLVSALTLTACGSKSKKTTMPENKGGTTTELKSSGGATGGATYGGAMTPTPTPKTNGTDPCGG